MGENSFKEIKKKLSKELETKRFEHTIGVADTAFCLALKYGIDEEKAYLAGLLHDCAKCYDSDRQKELIKKYKIKLSDSEKANSSLIHAKLGVYVAEDKYGIKDKEILSAIEFHTTGKPEMSILEKIIFSADYIEPNRKQIPGLDEIRRVIFTDIDKAVYMILKNTVDHLNTKNDYIDNTTNEAYLYYEKQQATLN